MSYEDFRPEIRGLFESGRQHPLGRLHPHIGTGETGKAKIVAEVGPEFLTGGERIAFRDLVRHHFPEEREAQEKTRVAERERHRKEHGEEVGSNLKRLTAERTERRLASEFEPTRGWNVTLDV